MTESARGEGRSVRRPEGRGPGPKRLVLGLDAGGGARGEVAGRVRERVGGELRVRDLDDPELLAWRERALGEEAGRGPMLFEVGGDGVRAWTGWRMGWALSGSIGPSAAWEVMRALGGVGSAPGAEGSAAAAVAMPALSGADPPAS